MCQGRAAESRGTGGERRPSEMAALAFRKGTRIAPAEAGVGCSTPRVSDLMWSVNAHPAGAEGFLEAAVHRCFTAGKLRACGSCPSHVERGLAWSLGSVSTAPGKDQLRSGKVLLPSLPVASGSVDSSSPAWKSQGQSRRGTRILPGRPQEAPIISVRRPQGPHVGGLCLPEVYAFSPPPGR